MTKFKAGDKVEFIEDYPAGPAKTGDRATVQYVDDGIAFFAEAIEGALFYRLKLAEERALTLDGFTVGDKVRYVHSYWKNLEGTVSSINGSHIDVMVTKLHDNATAYSSAKVGKTLVETCGGLGIDSSSLEKIEQAFTYADIQKGDTIRRTRTYGSAAKEVREGTVTDKGSYFWSSDNLILAYDTDEVNEQVTLELLNRPEPEPVKEAWETAEAGDQLIVKDRQGITRVLTKQAEGNWDALLIKADGTLSRGLDRTDSNVKVALTCRSFSDGKPEFIPA